MGIKGIYKEIGPGKRISLTKLAVQRLEESGRPLRIAIDISIWQFQVQAARGGSNPAIRTLFYRLLRLLSLAIQPIFVFDGPNKPVFKRNKRCGRGDGVATAMAKRLIRLFGFIIHDAPGEAEAECALLQQNGIVDAVLSEDVDTIMFGCTRTLRNWTSEGTKGSKTPTHVSMYDTQDLAQGASGLDREGMVLVALVSGGDYLPEGIPGAGVKLACEAARAGFGKSLCQIKRANASELASWREWLTYELRHNESGFFRTRHKALNIPDDFPNMDILRYYTHPVVSPAATIERLRQQSWDRQIDIQGLREFAQETFDWSYRIGAIKFIRVLAPCLLVRKLIQGKEDTNAAENETSMLVKSISSRREHFSTDATPELRLSFIPTNIVGYDFQNEPDEVIDFSRDGLALNSDDEIEELADEVGEEGTTAKSGPKKPFNPTEANLAWIPEVIARTGIPSVVEEWEEAQRAKAAARAKPKTSRQKGKAGVTTTSSLDKFLKVTKNTMAPATALQKSTSPASRLGLVPDSPSSSYTNPPMFSSSQRLSQIPPSTSRSTSKLPATKSSSRSKRTHAPGGAPKVADASTNPWTIASSQGSPSRVTKHQTIRPQSPAKASEPILISSSPPASPLASLRPPVSRARDRDRESEEDHDIYPFAPHPRSRRKRPSVSSPRPTIDEAGNLGRGIVGEENPLPASIERPQRKLARTESLPVDSSPRRPTSTRQTRGLARAQTVVIETLPLDSEDSEDDDDFDLPPLSSLISRLPKGKNTTDHPPSLPPLNSSPYSSSFSQAGILKPVPNPTSKPSVDSSTQEGKTQTTLKQSLSGGSSGGVKMTKLYMPRKSLPGFFKEVDVSVDEADALKEEYAAAATSGGSKGSGRRVGVWRRSDISCIDLTGED
ncbi:hypothetical protein F4808DRAFT_444631 [Astrocystis sublimbata]|nr:hypothetical protein F4808DRAFT_444631 [Astrocystis sublimbata]